MLNSNRFKRAVLMSRPFVAALMLGASTGIAHAETLWRIETSDADGKTETAEIWANKTNLRMSMRDGETSNEVILLGATDELILIDHDEKSFLRMKASEMAEQTSAAAAQLGGAQSQIQAAMAEAMAGLSPEERQQAEAAMAAMPGMAGLAEGAMGGGTSGIDIGAMAGIRKAVPKIALVKSEATHQVLGATATTFRMTRNGAPDGEIWAARATDVEGGAVIRDRMNDLYRFMSTAFGDLLPTDGGPFALVSEIDGMVPVGGVDIDGGNGAVTSRLVSAADISPPAGVWAPPSGYREQERPF